MCSSDLAGVGTLSLTSQQQRWVHWRFTLSRNVAAMRLQETFNQHCEYLERGEGRPPQLALRCPNCKRPLEFPGAECAACEGDVHTPPSTWGLFRLWRFAKPYQQRLLLGFVLTLASTAATLVPPYLTMPLMDEVLIPFQNGQAIDVTLVSWYLGGLLVASLVA